MGALTLLMPQDGWLTLAVRAAVIAASYVPIMYFVGMNAQEREEVKRIMQRRRRGA